VDDKISQSIVFFLLIVSLIGNFFLIYCLSTVINQQKTFSDALNSSSDALNYSIDKWYKKEIKPVAESEIQQISSDISKQTNQSEKIRMMAEWTATNVNDCYFNRELCWDGDWKVIESSGSYYTDKNGGIRVKKGSYPMIHTG